jgi:hypothetical protein
LLPPSIKIPSQEEPHPAASCNRSGLADDRSRGPQTLMGLHLMHVRAMR